MKRLTRSEERVSGGDAESGGLFDNIFNEADHYLTIQDWLDDFYVFVGTPDKMSGKCKENCKWNDSICQIKSE